MRKVDDQFWMKPYTDLCRSVLSDGEGVDDRTGHGTIMLVCPDPMRFDLRLGLPILPFKKMPIKSAVDEAMWFLRGDNDPSKLRYAKQWWEPHLREGAADLGPIYGVQWRAAPGAQSGPTDQLQQVLRSLHEHAHMGKPSRRHVVSLWGVGQQSEMALPCCHGTVIQFFVSGVGTAEPCLDMYMYQRSADVALGLPVNILSYAIILTMISDALRLRPRHLIISTGDTHVYRNHVDTLQDMLCDADDLRLSHSGLIKPVKLLIHHPEGQEFGTGSISPELYSVEDFELVGSDVLSRTSYTFPHNV